MSVRMKLTHSKTSSRRAHHRIGVPRLVKTAAGVRRRHFVDPATGMYRGKQIIAVGSADEQKSTKVAKKEVKKEAKASKETTKEVTKKTEESAEKGKK